MKDFSVSFQKGNLGPKERVLLYVHNQVIEETTGKKTLTDAEEYALGHNWKARSNDEAREFNRYNDGWNIQLTMSMSTQAIYLSAQNKLLRAIRVVDYALWNEREDRFKGLDLEVDDHAALELIIANSGLPFEKTVYKLAFQNLSDDLRQDILALSPDSATETQYLDQEEIIANLFDGKNSLSMEAKEKLADAAIEPHKQYADFFAKKGLPTNDWWFQGYFAELPMSEIPKKWAQDHTVSYITDDELFEKITAYAGEHKSTIPELLRTTLLKWMNEGLFTTEYTPIWNSNETATCNDVDTKLSHKDVLKAWITAKAEARTTLQQMVDDERLKILTKEQKLFGIGPTETIRILTGESLYYLEGDFRFADDFRKQANGIQLLGKLVLFLRNRKFLDDYATLLGVADIYKKLSVIYDIDLEYKTKEFLDEFRSIIGDLNRELRAVADRLQETVYCKNDIAFLMELFVNDLLIHPEDIQPIMGEMGTYYADKFRKSLGGEFSATLQLEVLS